MAALTLSGCVGEYASAPPPRQLSYADVADLVTASPFIVDLTVSNAREISPELSPGAPIDRQRFLVEGDVNTLIRGLDGVPGNIRFLADLPINADGSRPKLKGMRMFAFARPVPGRPNELMLSHPDGLLVWTPQVDAQVRAVTEEAVQINAPPVISGISSAFHSPGSIQGTGETQFFLNTEKGRPISMTVRTRPTEKSWFVSLGEVVSANAGPPAPNSLLWYRLACDGLPASVPSGALAGNSPADSAAVQQDYAFIRSQLGPCGRTLQYRAFPVATSDNAVYRPSVSAGGASAPASTSNGPAAGMNSSGSASAIKQCPGMDGYIAADQPCPAP